MGLAERSPIGARRQCGGGIATVFTLNKGNENMTQPDEALPIHALRRSVNSPRAHVTAIVAGLCALGGAVAGAAAALIAAAVLTPSEPVTAAQIALMAVEYGVVAGVAGSVLGTAVGFGALRRVPLGRLVLYPNLGLFAGLCAGWLGGPWAWHHMGFLGFVGFSAGAVLARVVTRGSSASNSSLASDSVRRSATIAPVLDRAERISVLPESSVPTSEIVDRARRSEPLK